MVPKSSTKRCEVSVAFCFFPSLEFNVPEPINSFALHGFRSRQVGRLKLPKPSCLPCSGRVCFFFNFLPSSTNQGIVYDNIVGGLNSDIAHIGELLSKFLLIELNIKFFSDFVQPTGPCMDGLPKSKF